MWRKNKDYVDGNVALRSAGDLVLDEAEEKVDVEWGKVEKGIWMEKRDAIGELYVYWKILKAQERCCEVLEEQVKLADAELVN